MKVSEAVINEIPPAGVDQPVKNKAAYRAIFSPENITLLGIIAAGLVLRWANIMVLPPFADEIQHVQGGLAAQSGKPNSEGLFNLIFASRVLQSWILGVIYFLAGNDNLLFLGRVFSGFCGLITILSC